MLAGVSIDYYVRMERGNLAGASDAVLEGVARALQLDDAERDHLFDLARGSEPQPARLRRSREPGVTASVQQVLDAITNAPAWVRNARHDMLAANRLARPVRAAARRPAPAPEQRPFRLPRPRLPRLLHRLGPRRRRHRRHAAT